MEDDQQINTNMQPNQFKFNDTGDQDVTKKSTDEESTNQQQQQFSFSMGKGPASTSQEVDVSQLENADIIR